VDLGIFFGIALAANIALSAVVGYVANQRGRQAINFFLLSFLASFLVGILVLLALPPLGDDGSIQRENCPHCDEFISLKASICPHCKSEVAVFFEAIQQQKEEALRLAEETEEAEASRRLADLTAERVDRSNARRQQFKRITLRPLTWIIVVAIGGIVIVTLILVDYNNRLTAEAVARTQELAAEEAARVDKLVRPNCAIASDSVSFGFDDRVTIKVSLPPVCTDGLRLALAEGLLSDAAELGAIKLGIFLDGVKVQEGSLELSSDVVSDYEFAIANSRFYTHAANRKTPAKTLKVEVSFESLFQTSPITSIEIAILEREPSIILDQTLQLSSSLRVTSVKYTSYQVADTIQFDWPLDSQDEVLNGYQFNQFTATDDGATLNGLVGSTTMYENSELEQLPGSLVRITARVGTGAPVTLEFTLKR
jgi:hypothetical protein